MRVAQALIAATLLASCGTGDPVASGAGSTATSADDLYRGGGTVIEERTDGPRLCFEVLDSYPPQCGGGLDLAGWEWPDADTYEAASGTRWGDFAVVGRWDGHTLTVVDIGPPTEDKGSWPDDDPDRFKAPCPEPAGGWVVPADAPKLGLKDHEAMSSYISAQPEYSASWADTSTDPKFDPERLGEYVHDFAAVVTVARFSADAERHEAALRELWGGPLCVIEGGVPQTELQRIMDEVSASIDTTWGNLDLVGGRVELGVNVLDPGVQEALDDRYGKGVVVLYPHLERVE